MESNPFATDIVDSFASDVPESDRLILHSNVFDSLEAILEKMRDREAAHRRGEAVGSSAPGQVRLLLAPAAGYGKTYFLACAGRALSEEFEMVSLRFQKGATIGWSSVFNDLVEHCCEGQAPSGELRLVDEMARRVFADLTTHLIRSGEVPTPNPEEAVRALTEKPLEVFDFSNAEGQIVQWFCSVFELLLPSIAAEAQRRYGMTLEAATFWLRALFEHSQEVVKNDGVLPSTKRFFAGLAGDGDEAVVERLSGLGRLLCRWRPTVFIADHLDSFFGEKKRGGKLAGLLMDLPEVVPGSLTVISVNEDLWDSAFRGSLPGAIEDRLSSEALSLKGMSPEEAKQIVEQRLADAGIPEDRASGFLPWVELGDGAELGEGGEFSPRQLLRWAKQQWDAFVESGYGAPEVSQTEKGVSEESLKFKHSDYDPLEPLVFDRHLTLRPKRFKLPRRGEVPAIPKTVEVEEVENEEEKGVPELAETLENLKAEAQKTFFEFHEIFKEALTEEGTAEASSAVESEVEEEEIAVSEEEVVQGLEEVEDRESTSERSIAKAIDLEEEEPVVIDEGGGSLAEEYNRSRREVLAGLEPGDFDLVRFYAVLNGVGELLPVIVQNEFDLPENPGFRVLEWSNESQLVFFGLLSVKNSDYWNTLIHYASRFIEKENGGASGVRERIVKVVVLTRESDAVEATHWQEEFSDPGGRFSSIDVIEVDEETVAAVYAFAQMLDEARNNGRAGRCKEVLRFAIRELDFFWRRLTRGS